MSHHCCHPSELMSIDLIDEIFNSANCFHQGRFSLRSFKMKNRSTGWKLHHFYDQHGLFLSRLDFMGFVMKFINKMCRGFPFLLFEMMILKVLFFPFHFQVIFQIINNIATFVYFIYVWVALSVLIAFRELNNQR